MTEPQPVKSWTTSSEFNRVMPLVLPLLLWGLCRYLSEGIIAPYAAGFIDGAFQILIIRAIVVVVRSYRLAGNQDLLEAKKGVILGLCVGMGIILLAILGLVITRI